MVCSSNKSLVAEKLAIHFNFISFQEIFIEHLPPDSVLGTDCANTSKTIPWRNEIVLRNDQSGISARNRSPSRYFKQVEISSWNQMITKSQGISKECFMAWSAEMIFWVPPRHSLMTRRYILRICCDQCFHLNLPLGTRQRMHPFDF